MQKERQPLGRQPQQDHNPDLRAKGGRTEVRVHRVGGALETVDWVLALDLAQPLQGRVAVTSGGRGNDLENSKLTGNECTFISFEPEVHNFRSVTGP